LNQIKCLHIWKYSEKLPDYVTFIFESGMTLIDGMKIVEKLTFFFKTLQESNKGRTRIRFEKVIHQNPDSSIIESINMDICVS